MPIFVIQEHFARSHHFDFRLEKDGVFKSWAVPKGLPEKAGVKRLAVQVEDHNLKWGAFEGMIPEGEYGAGRVQVWDRGQFELLQWQENSLAFILHGEKARGRFRMIRFKRGGPRDWLLFRVTEN